ncbi:MAG TPA: STAS domain-containing protein [Ignavibacteriaceae bacterium]|nr:STAS domain-containing protein [Ignavibacterium sp.]HSL87775.1 STAS domain-containing protein [Ignavibacteriaceae bacterium]
MQDFERKVFDGYLVEIVNITRATAKEAKEFKQILDEDILYGHHNLIIDLSKCEFMDSTFIGVMVVTYKKLRGRGGIMKLIKPGLFANSLLNYTGTIEIFETYETLEEAVQSFRKQQDPFLKKIYSLL